MTLATLLKYIQAALWPTGSVATALLGREGVCLTSKCPAERETPSSAEKHRNVTSFTESIWGVIFNPNSTQKIKFGIREVKENPLPLRF